MSGVDLAAEEIVSLAASFLFDIASRDGGGGYIDWQVVAACQIAYEGFVGLGIGTAEFVIDVEDRCGEAEFAKSVEEKYRVGSRGNGDTGFLSGMQHLLSLDGAGNAVDHALF